MSVRNRSKPLHAATGSVAACAQRLTHGSVPLAPCDWPRAQVGQELVAGMRQLAAEWPGIIGDVRGMGLMVGLDIVTDPRTKRYAPVMAK